MFTTINSQLRMNNPARV